MAKWYAVRTARLCDREGRCRYVCPMGATDLAVIARENCIGCGLCAEACRSGAISMLPAVDSARKEMALKE